MKTVGKVVGGFVGLIVIGLGFVFYLTGDMVDSVDTFFAHVKQGQLEDAYAELSKEFQSSVSLPQLESFLTATSLQDFKEASWSSRSFENNTGDLKGTVTLTSGASIPLHVKLIKEDGAWKIYHLKKQAPGLSSDQASPLPDTEHIRALIDSTTAAFGKAVSEKSMKSFHAVISKLWQSQYSVEKLDEAYQSLYAMDAAQWDKLHTLQPGLRNAPSINADGVLVVNGYYPTRPDTVVFTYKFLREAGEWKLFGVHINFEKPKMEEQTEVK